MDRWKTERLHEGLKVIVVENGTIQRKLPNLPRQEVVRPCIGTTWNQDQHEAMRNVSPGGNVRYTTGELSVSSVAYQVGYSPARFSVAFRERFGMSPKDLRH